MTMETVASRQDGSVNDSLSDGDVIKIQNESACSPISSLTQVSVGGSGGAAGPTAVTVVQLPGGQTIQVQGVIQTPQPSVIQSPQSNQVAAAGESEDGEMTEAIDSQKRREILSRRPSYRKILNELSSDTPAVPKIEEEKSEEETAPSNIPTMPTPASIYQTSSGQYIAITQGGAIQISSAGGEGLQTLTMSGSGAPQPGATIVQYAPQAGDGHQQFFVPGSQVVVQGTPPLPLLTQSGSPEPHYEFTCM